MSRIAAPNGNQERRKNKMCEKELPANIVVEHIYGASVEPLKIKLEKNTKGYNWEISCAGSDMADILCKLRAADAALKAEWGAT